MIIDTQPISMAEAMKYVDKKKHSDFVVFTKGFGPLSVEKAEALRKSLQELEIIKLNDKHLAKIIEMLPEDKDALNKILPEANLDENEQESVLNAIKGN